MNKDELKGKINEAKGNLTDDESAKLKGKAQQAVGKAKDKAEETVDDAAGKVNDYLDKKAAKDTEETENK